MAAPDLNCVILRGERRNGQPAGSRGGHRQRYEQRQTDHNNAFHTVSSHRMIAILAEFPGCGFVPRRQSNLKNKVKRSRRLPVFPGQAD
jgi:hypothetical protein